MVKKISVKTPAVKVKPPKPVYTEQNPLVAYKGFNSVDIYNTKGLFCRNYQFKVGKIHSVRGPVTLCGNGFHACIKPHHVRQHYNYNDSDGNENKFAIVHQFGTIKKDSQKHCSQHIKVVKIIKTEDFKRLVDIHEGDINKKSNLVEVDDSTFRINKVKGAFISVVQTSNARVISEAENATVIGTPKEVKLAKGGKIVLDNGKILLSGKDFKVNTLYRVNSRRKLVAC